MVSEIFIVLVIAIGLSFDTFAVSVSIGISLKEITFWKAFRTSVVFAFFQAAMPLIGWLLGTRLKPLIEPVDHWIAFVLFSVLALKMLFESRKTYVNNRSYNLDSITVISLAVATSIDAFIIGISLALINIPILMSCVMIGIVTFLVAMTGIKFGKSLGTKFGTKAIFAGALILFLIGAKILYEHIG